MVGEEGVVAAGVLEVAGGVDERGGRGVCADGPVVPGVEGVELLVGGAESVVVAVEAAAELLVGVGVRVGVGRVRSWSWRVGRGGVGRGG